MAFDPKEGFTRHSALVSFNDFKMKQELLGKCKGLKDLDDNNWLKSVYIKSEQPRLTSKINFRLYGELKKIKNASKDDPKDASKDDPNVEIKLDKRKIVF